MRARGRRSPMLREPRRVEKKGMWEEFCLRQATLDLQSNAEVGLIPHV